MMHGTRSSFLRALLLVLALLTPAIACAIDALPFKDRA